METETKWERIGGCDIVDRGNGLSTIVAVEDPAAEPERGGFWQTVLGWLKRYDAAPYVKIRDMADPTGDRRRNPDDIDAGSDGKIGGEIGVKISF